MVYQMATLPMTTFSRRISETSKPISFKLGSILGDHECMDAML